MKAYHTRKLTALLLAAMIIIASIAQFVSAEETVYYTETGFPKLDDVRGQLDADEIVAAGDVEINMGDIFNPTEVSCFKVESTGADADKVNISIFSARATDGTVFTSNLPGSYFAYYVVSPVSGHPAYEICRRITVNVVEQPAAPEVVETAEPVPEDAPAEDDSEDDPYEEPQADDSQAAAPVGEGEPEPEPEVAEELPEVYVDSPEAVPGDEPSDWPEEPANIPDITDDTFTEEYSDDEGFGEDMTADDPSTEYPTGDSIPSPESGILSDSAPENPASNMPQVHDEPIQTGEDTPAIPEEPSADENTPEPGGELPVPEDAAEDGDTPGESPETDGAVPEDDNPDNVETEDGEWETSMPADEPAEIDAPVISAARSLSVASDVLMLAAGDDDDASEEDDDTEDIDPDNIVLEGPAKMSRGKKVKYPASLGSWSTFKYTVDGKKAYCLESEKTSPKGGSFAQEIIDTNPNLTKALYYGYGGPADLSASFFPNYSANVRYILTHIAASYFYTGSYAKATNGCSSSGLKKFRVKEWIDYLAALEDPPSPALSLSDKSLQIVAVSGGAQVTSSTTLNADHRNYITLGLPGNVTYHNDNTGESQTGGVVTISGGTTFHFSAPASISGSWKSGDMSGIIGMIWKVLVVKTGTKTQKLGSYASEEYGGQVHFTVKWMDHFTLNVAKRDAETDSAQGDAKLSGAVYGVYARDDIVCPGNPAFVIHGKDAQVGTVTTDGNGNATLRDLFLGNYYVKEITPSEGYLLDGTAYQTGCTQAGEGGSQPEVQCVVKETVMKQPAEIIKAANNGKTDADLLEGAGFKAWLVSSLSKNADGSYDFNSASPVRIGQNGETEIFTDSRGHAVTAALPYGVYVFRETTTPKDFLPVKDFIVTVNENHPTTPQVWRVLLDEEFAAKLKIIKVDSETGRTVLVPGAEFNIYNLDKGEYVTQVTTYPQPRPHTVFTTDESGTLTLPETLRPGHYRVTEISAPEGYLLKNATADVTIGGDAAYKIDVLSGDPVIEVILRDDAAKGRITVYKEGEMLTGYQDGQFIYTLCRLPGASFDVIAAEDIYTADHQTDEDGNRYVEYGEGTVVAKLTTDEYGEASTGELPLGSYSIVERQAPNGFVLNGNTYTVALEYAGQEVEVVTEIQTVGDERQKVDIVVEKKALGKDILLPGAEFALYAGEDILCNGAVLVPAGTHLASAITDETGVAHFDIDLPLGKYLANELRAPDGYVKSDEVIELDASYQGQELARITIPGTIENAPTRVAISKADATTDVELDGAQLTLLDSEGNEVESWTSVASEPHIIECLKIGETYTLREDIAPYGYLISNSVKFTVGDTDVLQKAVIKDDVPTGTIIINKKGEFLGAVSAMDNVGGWIENVFSFFKGNLPDVTFAVYAAEDIKHADGVTEDYYKAEDFIANITTDRTGIAVLEGLPLGKYVVREVETVDGYVLSDEEHYINLCYRDSMTPYVTFSEEWQNDRMKVRVKVTKASEGESTLLEGACFGLFNEEDITTDTGKVLLKADSLIQQRATDSSGCLVFDADLPTDFSYYIQEIVPPAGYASDPEVQRFFFERVPYIDEATIYREFSFVDKPTVVEVTKSSLTTGEELEGASLQVTDGDGKVIDNWISEKEPHVITGLVVGKTYTLTETLPVEGYTTAESIAFTIADTGDVQPIEMKDDVTKVEISKTDITGKKELPDAKLTILDSEGEVVETWTSTDEPHYIEMLPIGKYTLREETAPKGYLVAEDVEFEVTDTAEIQRCVMKDAEENPDKPGTPKTGDTRNPVLWVGVSVVALLGLMTAVLVMRKNRRKF